MHIIIEAVSGSRGGHKGQHEEGVYPDMVHDQQP